MPSSKPQHVGTRPRCVGVGSMRLRTRLTHAFLLGFATVVECVAVPVGGPDRDSLPDGTLGHGFTRDVMDRPVLRGFYRQGVCAVARNFVEQASCTTQLVHGIWATSAAVDPLAACLNLFCVRHWSAPYPICFQRSWQFRATASAIGHLSFWLDVQLGESVLHGPQME